MRHNNITSGTNTVGSSVADPGCLSRIPDPKTVTKERGEKKLVVIPFFKISFFLLNKVHRKRVTSLF
jgi:hypothetical protein